MFRECSLWTGVSFTHLSLYLWSATCSGSLQVRLSVFFDLHKLGLFSGGQEHNNAEKERGTEFLVFYPLIWSFVHYLLRIAGMWTPIWAQQRLTSRTPVGDRFGVLSSVLGLHRWGSPSRGPDTECFKKEEIFGVFSYLPIWYLGPYLLLFSGMWDPSRCSELRIPAGSFTWTSSGVWQVLSMQCRRSGFADLGVATSFRCAVGACLPWSNHDYLVYTDLTPFLLDLYLPEPYCTLISLLLLTRASICKLVLMIVFYEIGFTRVRRKL